MRRQWATPVTANASPNAEVERGTSKRSAWRRAGTAAVAVAMSAAMLGALPAPAAQAAAPNPINTLSLNVTSARTEPRFQGGVGSTKGEAIPQFKFILNVDDTGTMDQKSPTPGTGCAYSDPGYPQTCKWPSITEPSGWSPIYAQGNQGDLAALTVPDGRYLISVMADDYKIDGAHFCVETGAPVPGCATPLDGPLDVSLQPNPLPDGTLRALVFEDNAPTNMGWDVGEALLPNFVGHVVDTLGEIQTDVYGNPLCTRYEGENPNTYEIPLASLDPVDMTPIPIPGSGGKCVSDAEGMLAIPHLGSNRYSVSATPPDGTSWIQSTTLEGNHDYDAWLMEGDTGYSTIFARGGEPTPDPIFGYVKPTNTFGAGSGHITGSVVSIKTYTPPRGGAFDFWGGNTGTKVNAPIDRPVLSLSDLQAGDVAVWVGRGAADGTFDISGVPDGDYTLSWFDEPQDYNMNMINVTVSNGETVVLGQLPLNGWWTEFSGTIFNDTNRNGRQDPGEPGVPNFTLTLRHRENNLLDRGTTTVNTDPDGHYYFESGYPIGEWNVLEAYNDSYYTTGVTYQTDNQNTPTTVKGAGVDVSVLPMIGLSGNMDWGVHAYDPTGKTNGLDPRNGGIVGTVSYDTTRNELDPQYAATEDWQPGISGVPVELYATVPCDTNPGTPCDADGRYELASDGSYAHGPLLNTYLTESWERPTGCTARDVDGNPLISGVDEKVLAPDQTTTGECISSFMQEIQYGPYATAQGTPDANFGAAVNGNYGFGDGCFLADGLTPGEFNPVTEACTTGDFAPLPGGRDYLVKAAIPNDATGNPMYKVTGEEDINIGNGDQIIPQVPPPACAGPLHTVDLADPSTTDNYPAVIGDGGATNDLPVGVTVPASTPVDNATFVDIGGSPFEGTQQPRCDTKLVGVNNGKSIVPIFNVFTDVPVPGRMRTVIPDDLRFSNDPRSIMFGEKAGIPFIPVGIYDYNNKLEYTAETDFNGIYDVLMPSTNHISCPTPSGVCANMYRFVANDPGIPGRLNPNYNPAFVTMAAGAESLPGLSTFADIAPTQVGLTVESPQTGSTQQVTCPIDTATPQLLAVSDPYVNGSGAFTISGTGFGANKGAGQVTLDNTSLPTTGWSDTTIGVTVPAGTPVGPHQLNVTSGNGQTTVNGLTFHVLGSSSAPFPGGAVLDYFNRSTPSTTQTLGSNWAGPAAASSLLTRITPLAPASDANQAQVRGGLLGLGNGYWNAGSPLGTNQDAYFTFTKTVNSGSARKGGLLLKVGTTFGGLINQYLSVTYNGTNVVVESANSTLQAANPIAQATIPGTFANGDTLGARALADGTVNVYKNGNLLGSTNVAAFGALSGRIGIRFATNSLTGFSPTNDARFDNFGGGNVSAGATYNPNLYLVGPGKAYATIQAALDAAHTSAGNDLVIVYPNTVDLGNPRLNPRGSYYENLIMASPVKLQGVGPGGFAGSTFVPGSIIDASAFSSDIATGTAWFNKVGTMTWDGNQTVSDGEAIYVLASANQTTGPTAARQFTSSYKAAIDGFDIRGGNDNGFPGNINDLTGGNTGLPPTVETQGGAIFANAYARYLQITNNVVQNNGSGYGTVRVGTPDLVAPDTNQHNENVRIANNRILANGGTNLAGGVGLYSGSDNYEVSGNDICGNFSLEYGGGLSVYGYSPNGKIHHNRIYFNSSNDEGGGIMIAGALAPVPGQLSAGSGAVDIYANQIQANIANDDGGGIRFLSSGNFPMNVYNNMIVNNVSTHEGGGIGIDDAPNIRLYNNTIMKNLTTATAVTSDGTPAPAGVSAADNSDQLQATLPAGSPTFSNPLMFNNIFWDNRAGTRAGTTVTGLGLAGDPQPIDEWDVGVAYSSGLMAPTNSVLQQGSGHPYVASPTNSAADPQVAGTYDVSVGFSTWRQNPAFVDATLVTVEQPPNLLGNYHLTGASPALNLGAASKTVPTYQAPPASLAAPATDIDDQVRPTAGGFDSGADEFGAAAAPPVVPPGVATSSIYFSTFGNGNVPGAAGTPDDADIYLGASNPFIRSMDTSEAPYGLPLTANVDGFDRVDANHFYMSFTADTTVPIVGTVQNEDVVEYNGGNWSLYFDGTPTTRGLSATNVDAISVSGGVLYYSTSTSTVPTGAGGTGDDADIYSWSGTTSTRVLDASALPAASGGPLPTNADVDGFVRVDATHYYMSFSLNTVLPGLGVVQDEDVAFNNGGTWSVYFDGTAQGLTPSGDLDVDAFDVS